MGYLGGRLPGGYEIPRRYEIPGREETLGQGGSPGYDIRWRAGKELVVRYD